MRTAVASFGVSSPRASITYVAAVNHASRRAAAVVAREARISPISAPLTQTTVHEGAERAIHARCRAHQA